MKKDKELDLGAHVMDIVTSFTGFITARAVYFYGPTQYLVEGIDTTDRPIADWYTSDRLTEINE